MADSTDDHAASPVPAELEHTVAVDTSELMSSSHTRIRPRAAGTPGVAGKSTASHMRCCCALTPAQAPLRVIMETATKSPAQVILALQDAASARARLSWSAFVLQSFLAGFFIGMGGHFSTAIAGNCPGLATDNPGLQKLLFATVFPFGLIAILLTQAALFTGDVMVLLLGVFDKRLSLRRYLALLALEWVMNYAGCLAVLFPLVYSPQLYTGACAKFAAAVVERKVHLGWGNALMLGVGANFLVCIAIIQATAAADVSGKVLAIWWPIAGFTAMAFEHCVANMYMLSSGAMFGGNVSAFDVLIMNLLPVSIGNALAAVFAAYAYHHIFGPSLKAQPQGPASDAMVDMDVSTEHVADEPHQ